MKTRYRIKNTKASSSPEYNSFRMNNSSNIILSLTTIVFFSFVGVLVGGWNGALFYAQFIGIPIGFSLMMFIILRYIYFLYKTRLRKYTYLPYKLSPSPNTMHHHKYFQNPSLRKRYNRYKLRKNILLNLLWSFILTFIIFTIGIVEGIKFITLLGIIKYIIFILLSLSIFSSILQYFLKTIWEKKNVYIVHQGPIRYFHEIKDNIYFF